MVKRETERGEKDREEEEGRRERKRVGKRAEDKFTKLQSTAVNDDDVVSTVHPHYSKQCLFKWPLISKCITWSPRGTVGGAAEVSGHKRS